MQEGLTRYIRYYNSMRSHLGINGLTLEKRLEKLECIKKVKKNLEAKFDSLFYFDKIKNEIYSHSI